MTQLSRLRLLFAICLSELLGGQQGVVPQALQELGKLLRGDALRIAYPAEDQLRGAGKDIVIQKLQFFFGNF